MRPGQYVVRETIPRVVRRDSLSRNFVSPIHYTNSRAPFCFQPSRKVLEVAVGINLHDHRNSVIINLAASNLMWKSNFVGDEDGCPSLSLVLERGNINGFPNDRDLLPCCTTGTFPCSGHPSLLGPSGYLVESVVHPEFELQVHQCRRYPNSSSV